MPLNLFKKAAVSRGLLKKAASSRTGLYARTREEFTRRLYQEGSLKVGDVIEASIRGETGGGAIKSSIAVTESISTRLTRGSSLHAQRASPQAFTAELSGILGDTLGGTKNFMRELMASTSKYNYSGAGTFVGAAIGMSGAYDRDDTSMPRMLAYGMAGGLLGRYVGGFAVKKGKFINWLNKTGGRFNISTQVLQGGKHPSVVGKVFR